MTWSGAADNGWDVFCPFRGRVYARPLVHARGEIGPVPPGGSIGADRRERGTRPPRDGSVDVDFGVGWTLLPCLGVFPDSVQTEVVVAWDRTTRLKVSNTMRFADDRADHLLYLWLSARRRSAAEGAIVDRNRCRRRRRRSRPWPRRPSRRGSLRPWQGFMNTRRRRFFANRAC